MARDPRMEWEQELRDRQTHNYVFPGTMINSTAAVRKLVEKPLRGKLQKVGFILWFCPAYLFLIGILLGFYRWTREPDFSWGEAATSAAMGLGVLLGIAGFIVLLLAIPYTMNRVRNYEEELQTRRPGTRDKVYVGRRKNRNPLT